MIDHTLTGLRLTLVFGLCVLVNATAARAEDRSGIAASPTNAMCSNTSETFADSLTKPHWNGWGVNSSQRRFQPLEMAQLAPEDVPKLKVKWAFGFPGVSRTVSQVAVLGGRIFVGSDAGKVYSLNADSGCLYWELDAEAGVRSAITVSQDTRGWSAYFGDRQGKAYAVDALTGKVLWKTQVDDHLTAVITGAPALIGTTLFVPVSSWEELRGANPRYPCCTFRGSLAALDASTGKILWKSYTISQEARSRGKNQAGAQLMGPSGAGVWSSPTFDAVNSLIYVTTGDNYSDPPTDTSDAFLAFRIDSGELAWSRQLTSGDAYNMACGSAAPMNCPESKGPDHDFGSSPILVDLSNGKRALIGAQKSGMVTAIDPDHQGEILWQKRIGRGGLLGGVEWGAATDQSNVYVALSDVVFRAVPHGTPGSQEWAVNPKVSFLLDHKAGGGLYALKLETGAEVWHTPHPGCGEVLGCSPAQSAAVTAIPGLVFSGGLDGHIRAYSTKDGRIVWDADTRGEHRTVNGVTARGGSINGPGPVVVGGVVYVSSGYGSAGTIPGNVLLAYSVDGK